MIANVMEAYTDLLLKVYKNVWTMAQLVMNQVFFINGGNDCMPPHVVKLKIAADNACNIPL